MNGIEKTIFFHSQEVVRKKKVPKQRASFSRTLRGGQKQNLAPAAGKRFMTRGLKKPSAGKKPETEAEKGVLAKGRCSSKKFPKCARRKKCNQLQR